jgi:hypothetical protein
MKNEKSRGKASQEPHLKIFSNRSVLVDKEGAIQEFIEGRSSQKAHARFLQIHDAFRNGFLVSEIEKCGDPKIELEPIPEHQLHLLEFLVNSVTSERGRAVVGLTILQLCIKAICPEQSVRLHKSSPRSGTFSWKEGISMRTLDANYVTPVLRGYDLLHVNKFGVMMTRTLAENYPYTSFFKAEVRGAKKEWLRIIDMVESGEIRPDFALRYLLVMLRRRSEQFKSLVSSTLSALRNVLTRKPDNDKVIGFFKTYISAAQYSSRLLEIGMHSLYQALSQKGVLDGYLKPLSQMRSANKKHGDIADIQVISSPGALDIIEAWDAKFGKPYLRDEIEELDEKLRSHPETEIAGFVIEKEPVINQEIRERIREIEEEHGIEIKLLSFDDWVRNSIERYSGDVGELVFDWLAAFVESLCQMRREMAPIDEPSDLWVADLEKALRETFLV